MTASAAERPTANTVRSQRAATWKTNRYQRINTSSMSGSIRSVRRYQRCRTRKASPSRLRWRAILSQRTASRSRLRSMRSARRARRWASHRSRLSRLDERRDAGRASTGPGATRGRRFFCLPTAVRSFHVSPGVETPDGIDAADARHRPPGSLRKRFRGHDTGNPPTDFHRRWERGTRLRRPIPPPILRIMDERVRLADGRSLEVVVQGAEEGTLLVFHHGSPGAAEPFEPFHRAATDRGIVLAFYSRPGFGESSRHEGRIGGERGGGCRRARRSPRPRAVPHRRLVGRRPARARLRRAASRSRAGRRHDRGRGSLRRPGSGLDGGDGRGQPDRIPDGRS